MKDKLYLDSETLLLVSGTGIANEQLTVTESFAERFFDENTYSNCP
jgi:hypothetical protein